VCYQTRDLIEAMQSDWSGGSTARLRVDGGMAASDWTMQFLADILDAPVERPTIGETTALGVAWLAGHKAGVWPDAQGFGRLWKLDRSFKPALPGHERERKYAGWKRAVGALLGHAGNSRAGPAGDQRRPVTRAILLSAARPGCALCRRPR